MKYLHKKSLYSLCSNGKELIDVTSEVEMESFSKEFIKSM